MNKQVGVHVKDYGVKIEAQLSNILLNTCLVKKLYLIFNMM